MCDIVFDVVNFVQSFSLSLSFLYNIFVITFNNNFPCYLFCYHSPLILPEKLTHSLTKFSSVFPILHKANYYDLEVLSAYFTKASQSCSLNDRLCRSFARNGSAKYSEEVTTENYDYKQLVEDESLCSLSIALSHLLCYYKSICMVLPYYIHIYIHSQCYSCKCSLLFGMSIIPNTYAYILYIHFLIKGSVQRKLRWVENGVNRSEGASDCGAGRSFVLLFGFHVGFAIFRFRSVLPKLQASSGRIGESVRAMQRQQNY